MAYVIQHMAYCIPHTIQPTAYVIRHMAYNPTVPGTVLRGNTDRYQSLGTQSVGPFGIHVHDVRKSLLHISCRGRMRSFAHVGNPEKYKQKPVFGLAAVGRYKKSLYFSLVPAWYDCHSLALFQYDHQIIPS